MNKSVYKSPFVHTAPVCRDFLPAPQSPFLLKPHNCTYQIMQG